jgi:hypothetical protein
MTAVEWLVEQICGDHTSEWQKQIEQAKEMERQQIMSAFTQGDIFGADYYDGVNITEENYYKQTFEDESNN